MTRRGCVTCYCSFKGKDRRCHKTQDKGGPQLGLFTYLFGDLTGHLFSKVPVLTDSVEQLATLHHFHNNQEPRSVKNDWRKPWKPGDGDMLNSFFYDKRFTESYKNRLSASPWAGFMGELNTVGINFQDLHYVWMVGTHHMETHLERKQAKWI